MSVGDARFKLQGSHASGPNIREALNRIKAIWPAPLPLQPAVNDGISKVIGQRVGKKPRKTKKGCLIKGWKLKIVFLKSRPDAHMDGGYIKASAKKVIVIFKGSILAAPVPERNPNIPAPQSHLDDAVLF